MLQTINPVTPAEITACFSGHRSARLPDGEGRVQLENSVYAAVEASYEKGYRAFIHGFCHGFDILAAKQVIRFREETQQDVLLLGIVPFLGISKGPDDASKADYAYVQSHTQVIDILSDHYSKSLYFIRNDMMIRQSSLLICYYDGKGKSGTGYTVGKAAKAGLMIENLYKTE